MFTIDNSRKIDILKILKAILFSFLSISIFFFQLFDHEGEVQVTLRNTGKVGFEFSITNPQRDDEADEEEGWQKTCNTKNKTEGEVRPGQPLVIPSMVSSSWSYLFQLSFTAILWCHTMGLRLLIQPCSLISMNECLSRPPSLV